MRFSENGYYLEAYLKCDNCGVLMYDAGIDAEIDGEQHRFCSDWCMNWHVTRQKAPQAREKKER